MAHPRKRSASSSTRAAAARGRRAAAAAAAEADADAGAGEAGPAEATSRAEAGYDESEADEQEVRDREVKAEAVADAADSNAVTPPASPNATRRNPDSRHTPLSLRKQQKAHRERFTELENALVIHAVSNHGTDWMTMRQDSLYEWRETLTSTDLKDKWRNLKARGTTTLDQLEPAVREDLEEHLQRHGRSLDESAAAAQQGRRLDLEGADGAADVMSPPSRKRTRRSPGGSDLGTPHKRRMCVALRPKNYKGGRVPFSRLEEYYVLKGYEKHHGTGTGSRHWAKILRDPDFFFHPKRSSVDLKDKYRNLVNKGVTCAEDYLTFVQQYGMDAETLERQVQQDTGQQFDAVYVEEAEAQQQPQRQQHQGAEPSAAASAAQAAAAAAAAAASAAAGAGTAGMHSGAYATGAAAAAAAHGSPTHGAGPQDPNVLYVTIDPAFSGPTLRRKVDQRVHTAQTLVNECRQAWGIAPHSIVELTAYGSPDKDGNVPVEPTPRVLDPATLLQYQVGPFLRHNRLRLWAAVNAPDLDQVLAGGAGAAPPRQ